MDYRKGLLGLWAGFMSAVKAATPLQGFVSATAGSKGDIT